jgi:drug/metabolite transporter (DMT)-like permease
MAQSSKPLDRFAVSIMIVLCASWGLQQISAKAALVDFAPIAQGALRSLGATVAVGAFALWREPQIFRRDGSLALGVLAGLIFAAEFISLFLAVQWTSAARVILFLYSAPFFVALGALLFLPRSARVRCNGWGWRSPSPGSPSPSQAQAARTGSSAICWRYWGRRPGRR